MTWSVNYFSRAQPPNCMLAFSSSSAPGAVYITKWIAHSLLTSCWRLVALLHHMCRSGVYHEVTSAQPPILTSCGRLVALLRQERCIPKAPYSYRPGCPIRDVTATVLRRARRCSNNLLIKQLLIILFVKEIVVS